MKGKILVAYATRSGSTAGVAAAVAKALSGTGLEVDLCAIDEVRDISIYGAAVIGAPIHVGRWVSEARYFLDANAAELRYIPVACFATCMSIVRKAGPDGKPPQVWLRAVKRVVEPVDSAVFSGAFDRSKEAWHWRVLTKLVGVPQGDFRDYDKINAWAARVGGLLVQAAANDS